jgi:NADPH-dependent ferric siderophore reductase
MSPAQHITRTGQFLAQITAVSQLSPRMRRLTFRDAAIALTNWPLACDIAVVLTGEDGREVRRRYTVRSVDGDSLSLDAVLHGHGPGSSWASGAAVGDHVQFHGPRGVIELSERASLLALADESGLPAIAALAESTDRPIRVLAEIADDAERYPLPSNAAVSWLCRERAPEAGPEQGGARRAAHPAGSADLLLSALDRLADANSPTVEFGYAYVLAESRASVVLRDALARFGLGRADVYAKGYWNLNSRATR